MKSLQFETKALTQSEELGIRLKYKLNNIEIIQDTLVLRECVIFTDNFKDNNRLIDIDNIEDIAVFVFLYIASVLKNNDMAKQHKNAPYDTFLKQKVDFEHKICQSYFYVDDSIFGVIVGSKFGNVIKLVEASFPIMSKLPYDIELRFFPISRV